MTTPASPYDLLVLGLGAVGSFALRQAAARGARVLGLERFGRAHDRGSSHGGTRIYRHAYFEHPDYVPLLHEATARFRALEQARGVPLLQPCGVLLVGPPGSPVLAGSAASAERFGVPVERLDAAALRRRFPQLAIEDAHEGLLEPGAGFVRPEAAIRAALEAAEADGALVRTDTAVLGLDEGPGGVTLRTADGPVSARRLLIAGGAWTAGLLPALAPLLRVTRQVQGWIEVDEPAADGARPPKLPCWLFDRGPGQRHLYGIPADPLLPGPARAKIAVHGSDRLTTPETLDREVAPAERAALQALAARHLPGLPGAVRTAAACMYTLTPDDHPIVDRLPGSRHTWLVAGLSGHGFKLAPALAAAAVDGLLDAGGAPPVDFLRLQRLLG